MKYLSPSPKMSVRSALLASGLVAISLPTLLAVELATVNQEGNATLIASPGLVSPHRETLSSPTSSQVHLQGILTPRFDAMLRPNVQGAVTEIHVREGDRVVAGDPLITFDDRVARASVAVATNAVNAVAGLEQAELVMKQTESQWKRTKIAFSTQAASEFELQAKQNQYEQAVAAYQFQKELNKTAQAQLKLAEAALDQLTLRAPFDGEVLHVFAKLGNTLDPAQVAVRIADLNELVVEMHLPTSLLGTVQTDRAYELFASTPVSDTISAAAQYVSPVVEPTSGTFRVLFQLPNSDRKWPAGVEVWFKPAVEHR